MEKMRWEYLKFAIDLSEANHGGIFDCSIGLTPCLKSPHQWRAAWCARPSTKPNLQSSLSDLICYSSPGSPQFGVRLRERREGESESDGRGGEWQSRYHTVGLVSTMSIFGRSNSSS
jgi:hypothetical protein